MGRLARPAEPRPRVPGWMVSFGDMMTLILTFFILLVSMSRERQIGLVARGIGSFVVHLRSYGLSGALTEQQKLEIHREVRVRFNLPPEEDPERATDPADAETRETVRAEDLLRMTPIDDLIQPAIASFAPGSAELTPEGRRYLDLLAPSLRPGPGQILVLETGAGTRPDLAKSRAETVEEHLARAGLDPARIDVRLWLARPQTASLDVVDARLVSPARKR